MQAIVTKYHGPTETKGSRITAKCGAGSVTVDYYALQPEAQDQGWPGEEGVHRAAAERLKKMLVSKKGLTHWDKPTAAGWIDGNSYAHVYLG